MSKQKFENPEDSKSEKGDHTMKVASTEPKTSGTNPDKEVQAPAKSGQEFADESAESDCAEKTTDTEPESGAICEFQ